MSIRQDREISKRRLKRFLRGLITIVVIFLFVFVVYSLYGYTINSIGRKNQQAMVARQGSIGDQVSVKAVVLTEESVFYAPAEGHFENLVRENDKVRKDDLLGHFIANTQQQPVQSAEAGIFTTKTDGLEKVFSSLNFQTVTQEVFQYKVITNSEYQGHCYSGYPVFKIVNNLKPTRLLVSFPQKKLKEKIISGQNVQVVYKDKIYKNATVRQIKTESNDIIMLIELANFCPQLIDRRYINGQCIYNIKSGYLIPLKAVVVKDNKKGIYCIRGQDVYFKAVRILKVKKPTAVVQGLKANDMVIVNPGFFIRFWK